MTATALQPTVRTDATWLRLMWIGIASATVGLVVLALSQTFWTTSSGGDFKYAADYWMTAPAFPIGIGLMLHAFAVHHLHHGRDGRLAAVGVWLFAVFSSVIVVQCMASLPAGEELRWGPAYPLCALGSFIGLALLAAGSWRAGLLPRWILGIWPPLTLLGSWAAQSLIPIALAAFLVATRIVIGRRIEAQHE
jgi:hypothetical protein